MKQILWIIIGIPGSGKSTLANKIADEFAKENDYRPEIYEADMFFINKEGQYNWNPNRLSIAHNWCFNQVEKELQKGLSVIVSNTNIKKRDRKPYIELGKKYNAEIRVITCTGNYKNIHNVPEDKIELLKTKFQPFDPNELE